jgi:hypothetical protein
MRPPNHVVYITNHLQQRAQTAELLTRRLSQTPVVNQVGAQRVPLTLQERLHEAQNVIDKELEEVREMRAALQHFDEVLSQHADVLQTLRTKYLC